jgi:hypothetical protein
MILQSLGAFLYFCHMKFRMLAEDELKSLEPELKQFLIVNGIHHDEWVRLNENDPDKAIALVELFSDMVLEKVYQKVKYLEYNSTRKCLFFKIEEKETDMISIEVKQGITLDLSDPDKLHNALKNHFNGLNFFMSKKPIEKYRELEIHELFEQGCLLSSKDMWQALQEVLDV